MGSNKTTSPKKTLSISVKSLVYNIINKKAEEVEGISKSRLLEPVLDDYIVSITNALDLSRDCAKVTPEVKTLSGEQETEKSYPDDAALSSDSLIEEVKKDVEKDNTD